MPLTIHFLNVGQGDCTIIEFPSGRIGMVDIDNLKILDSDTRDELAQEHRESLDYKVAKALNYDLSVLEATLLKKAEEQLTDPLAYYDTHIGKTKNIFRMIITHPHMDHITGLYQIHEQDWWKSIVNFWHTGFHDFNLADTTDTEWDSSRFDKRDWNTYTELRASIDNPKSLQKYQKATGEYWAEDGIEIWAPTRQLENIAVEKNDQNILSMVLKVSHAGRSIVLGGDATAKETWPEIYLQLDMTDIDILKASHHGRKSGYYQLAVEEMSPWLTITSVGEKAHDATDNYRRYSDHTVSLRKTGDISITIEDDGNISYPSEIEGYWKPKKT